MQFTDHSHVETTLPHSAFVSNGHGSVFPVDNGADGCCNDRAYGCLPSHGLNSNFLERTHVQAKHGECASGGVACIHASTERRATMGSCGCTLQTPASRNEQRDHRSEDLARFCHRGQNVTNQQNVGFNYSPEDSSWWMSQVRIGRTAGDKIRESMFPSSRSSFQSVAEDYMHAGASRTFPHCDLSLTPRNSYSPSPESSLSSGHAAQKQVVVHDWFIIKSAVGNGIPGQWNPELSVGGFLKPGMLEVDYVETALIVRRMERQKLCACDGVNVILIGLIDEAKSVSHGFPQVLVHRFMLGFPASWITIMSSHALQASTSSQSLSAPFSSLNSSVQGLLKDEKVVSKLFSDKFVNNFLLSDPVAPNESQHLSAVEIDVSRPIDPKDNGQRERDGEGEDQQCDDLLPASESSLQGDNTTGPAGDFAAPKEAVCTIPANSSLGEGEGASFLGMIVEEARDVGAFVNSTKRKERDGTRKQIAAKEVDEDHGNLEDTVTEKEGQVGVAEDPSSSLNQPKRRKFSVHTAGALDHSSLTVEETVTDNKGHSQSGVEAAVPGALLQNQNTTVPKEQGEVSVAEEPSSLLKQPKIRKKAFYGTLKELDTAADQCPITVTVLHGQVDDSGGLSNSTPKQRNTRARVAVRALKTAVDNGQVNATVIVSPPVQDRAQDQIGRPASTTNQANARRISPRTTIRTLDDMSVVPPSKDSQKEKEDVDAVAGSPPVQDQAQVQIGEPTSTTNQAKARRKSPRTIVKTLDDMSSVPPIIDSQKEKEDVDAVGDSAPVQDQGQEQIGGPTTTTNPSKARRKSSRTLVSELGGMNVVPTSASIDSSKEKKHVNAVDGNYPLVQDQSRVRIGGLTIAPYQSKPRRKCSRIVRELDGMNIVPPSASRGSHKEKEHVDAVDQNCPPVQDQGQMQLGGPTYTTTQAQIVPLPRVDTSKVSEAFGLKKSRRGRVLVPPLAFWRSQSIGYDKDGGIIAIFDGYEPSSSLPETGFNFKPPTSKSARTMQRYLCRAANETSTKKSRQGKRIKS